MHRWYDSFLGDVTHIHRRHVSFMCVTNDRCFTCLIHVRHERQMFHMTHSCASRTTDVSHDSFMCVTNDMFMCVTYDKCFTWPIHVRHARQMFHMSSRANLPTSVALDAMSLYFYVSVCVCVCVWYAFLLRCLCIYVCVCVCVCVCVICIAVSAVIWSIHKCDMTRSVPYSMVQIGVDTCLL